MVGFLHTRHHVTFRACASVLICLGFIFSSIGGNINGAIAMPGTLTTIFSRLGIKDDLVAHPVCFKCHRIFPPDINKQSFCPDCEEELFGPASQGGSEPDPSDEIISDSHNLDQPEQKPLLVAPIQVLSSGLRNFFKRPGMVSTVNSWKKQPRADEPRKFKSIQDAEV
jgi:hypothetical protein